VGTIAGKNVSRVNSPHKRTENAHRLAKRLQMDGVTAARLADDNFSLLPHSDRKYARIAIWIRAQTECKEQTLDHSFCCPDGRRSLVGDTCVGVTFGNQSQNLTVGLGKHDSIIL
jgi:hypothetical protein